MEQTSSRHRRKAMVLLDAVTILAGLFLSYWLSERLTIFGETGSTHLSLRLFTIFAVVTTLFILLIMIWQNVYRPNANQLKIEPNRRLVAAIFMAEAFMFIPFFYLQHRVDTRGLLTIMLIVVPIMLLGQKTFLGALLSKHFDHPLVRRKLLIVGLESDVSSLLRNSLTSWDPGYTPIGFLARHDSGETREVNTGSVGVQGSVPVLGTYGRLSELLEADGIEEIWLNDPAMSQDEIAGILDECNKHGVELCLAPVIGTLPAVLVEAVNVGGQALLRQKRMPERPYQDAIKRIMDIVLSSIAIVALSPIMLIIGIMIRLDSRGPIFFAHTRMGKDGKPFRMYKFRSMYSDTDPHSEAPSNREDSRITRVGRFIRRTSLDEMPQLFNVLEGSMSLVGPRPEMQFIVDQYNTYQRLRLAVKPGITGLWQISGDRSIPIHQNMDYDIYYIMNRSFITDIVILWRTVWFAFNGR